MERHRQRMSGWMVRAPDSDDDWVPAVAADAPIPSAADWHSTDDDGSDVIAPPTPVWKIDNGEVTAVDFGGELDDLAAVWQDPGRLPAPVRPVDQATRGERLPVLHPAGDRALRRRRRRAATRGRRRDAPKGPSP
jgi:hypothetical protein